MQLDISFDPVDEMLIKNGQASWTWAGKKNNNKKKAVESSKAAPNIGPSLDGQQSPGMGQIGQYY